MEMKKNLIILDMEMEDNDDNDNNDSITWISVGKPVREEMSLKNIKKWIDRQEGR